jgi:hypothetical protein
MVKTQNQAHFSKFAIQNVGSNLYGKNEKPASTEMDFIQKIRINRKFRVPRKQGAHFLGARAQIQDSLVFSSSV